MDENRETLSPENRAAWQETCHGLMRAMVGALWAAANEGHAGMLKLTDPAGPGLLFGPVGRLGWTAQLRLRSPADLAGEEAAREWRRLPDAGPYFTELDQ